MTIKHKRRGKEEREKEQKGRKEGGKKKYIPQMGDITSPRLPGNPAKLNKAAANTAVCHLPANSFSTDDNSERDE